MSEHDEWFLPVDMPTDFATDTENGIDWSRQEQERRQYDVPSQLNVEWGSDEYVRVVTSDADTYAGPYVANALFSAQTFATSNKLMSSDFAVRAINYTEAPNAYGKTVTIGG